MLFNQTHLLLFKFIRRFALPHEAKFNMLTAVKNLNLEKKMTDRPNILAQPNTETAKAVYEIYVTGYWIKG